MFFWRGEMAWNVPSLECTVGAFRLARRAALAYLRRRRRRLLLINTGVYNSTAATTGPQLLDISNTPVSS